MMKNVLITGASTGFGLGVATEMARMGWRVFATMRNLEKSTVLSTRADELGVSDWLEILPMDVTSQESIDAAVGQVLGMADGKIDALLNNAGYSIMGAFEDLKIDEIQRQMNTNFYGVLRVTQAVLPAMRAAQAGRILTVTSNAVNSPHPFLTIYAASKWAIEGWAEGLAMEVAPYGIEVGVVQPGAHRTPFAENVVPFLSEKSAYKQWADSAFPGVANLDKWGREPELAVKDIVSRLTADDFEFRSQSGEDARVFAMLKGAFPYEVRALVLRAIVGLPGIDEYVAAGPNTTKPGKISENGREFVAAILASLGRRNGDDQPLARELMDLIDRSGKNGSQ